MPSGLQFDHTMWRPLSKSRAIKQAYGILTKQGERMEKLNIPAEFQDIIKTCLDNGFFDLENL